MPRKKSGMFDQSKYVQQYIKENVTVKKVSFNKNTESDLLEFVEGKTFSTYVKDLIREKKAQKDLIGWLNDRLKENEHLIDTNEYCGGMYDAYSAVLEKIEQNTVK